MMNPISIIIPALNEQEYLPTLLQSFIDQDYDGEYELIIVDGGSTDDTLGVIVKYQKLLPNISAYKYKRGISRQRNYGVKKARYDNLIFLDADMKMPGRALHKIGKHFQKKTNFTAVPILFPYDGKFVDVLLGLAGYFFFVMVRRKHPILAGMCIITTKQAHERIGGFNEKAVVAEDIDYGLRAHESGAKYYILFNVLIRGSARRFDKMGRLKVAQTWKRWYKQTVETGAITDRDQYDYEFGKFKTKASHTLERQTANILDRKNGQANRKR
jgi:glycosyltransferase involved in cell wall biosynthesis